MLPGEKGWRRILVRWGRSLLGLLLLALPAWACATRSNPPGPGETRGLLPDLRGQSVLVLPVQLRSGVPDGTLADAELAHAFRTRGQGVAWVFPPEMEQLLARSPGVPARIRDLPVGVFLRAEVERVGDPLYGDLRRLSALTGADVALIPVELRYTEGSAYRLTAALVSLRSGTVAWLGVIQGNDGPAEDPGTLASVAERLARAILPFGSDDEAP